MRTKEQIEQELAGKRQEEKRITLMMDGLYNRLREKRVKRECVRQEIIQLEGELEAQQKGA